MTVCLLSVCMRHHVCTEPDIHGFMHVHFHVNMHVYVDIHVWVSVSIYVCIMRTCTHIYESVHIVHILYKEVCIYVCRHGCVHAGR